MDNFKEGKQKDIRREVIERYCHVIDKNAVILRTTDENCKTSSLCMNKEKCNLSGGCKNYKFCNFEA